MPPGPPHRHDAPTFREAVSQWRLDARTAVKRASCLPTALFDAADATVEARLLGAAAAMLDHLPRTDERSGPPSPLPENRERPTTEELRRLPSQLAGDDGPADLDADVSVEAFAVLVDACETGDAAVGAAAAAMLRAEYGVGTADDLDRAAVELHASALASADADLIAAVCRRVAAAVVATANGTADGGRTA